MSPVKATTAEELRKLRRARQGKEHRAERLAAFAASKIAEEEEVATYFGICPLFAAGLMELNEANFISLMLRTRQFMIDRALYQMRGETVIEIYRKWKS